MVAEADSGHAIVLDGSPEHGGRNLGIRPMEAVLIGVGACSAVDVVSILHKARERVTGCEVLLDGERVDTIPRVFGTIRMTYRVTGHDLRERAVQRAVELSAEKYCSATAMLRPKVTIERVVEIVEADEEDPSVEDPTGASAAPGASG